jgi:hypothetical protein
MQRSLHLTDKRHDRPNSLHRASLIAETNIFFGQISLMAWPLKAAAEALMGGTGVRSGGASSESMSQASLCLAKIQSVVGKVHVHGKFQTLEAVAVLDPVQGLRC